MLKSILILSLKSLYAYDGACTEYETFTFHRGHSFDFDTLKAMGTNEGFFFFTRGIGELRTLFCKKIL